MRFSISTSTKSFWVTVLMVWEWRRKFYFIKRKGPALKAKNGYILAGLPISPQAATSPVYKPGVKGPTKYVTRRMADEGFITRNKPKAISEPLPCIPVSTIKTCPYYTGKPSDKCWWKRIKEEMVLDKGIKIYTSLDLKTSWSPKQVQADGIMRSW